MSALDDLASNTVFELLQYPRWAMPNYIAIVQKNSQWEMQVLLGALTHKCEYYYGAVSWMIEQEINRCTKEGRTIKRHEREEVGIDIEKESNGNFEGCLRMHDLENLFCAIHESKLYNEAPKSHHDSLTYLESFLHEIYKSFIHQTTEVLHLPDEIKFMPAELDQGKANATFRLLRYRVTTEAPVFYSFEFIDLLKRVLHGEAERPILLQQIKHIEELCYNIVQAYYDQIEPLEKNHTKYISVDAYISCYSGSFQLEYPYHLTLYKEFAKHRVSSKELAEFAQTIHNCIQYEEHRTSTTENKMKEIDITPVVADMLIEDIGGMVTPLSEFKALLQGRVIKRKLVYKGTAKDLCDIFNTVQRRRNTKNDSKTVQNWLIKNFKFKYRGQTKCFNSNTVEKHFQTDNIKYSEFLDRFIKKYLKSF